MKTQQGRRALPVSCSVVLVLLLPAVVFLITLPVEQLFCLARTIEQVGSRCIRCDFSPDTCLLQDYTRTLCNNF